MDQEEKYHLYQHVNGDFWAAPTLGYAMEVWAEETGEERIPDEWTEVPDEQVLTDGDGVSKAAVERAKEYQDSHGEPGCIGRFD